MTLAAALLHLHSQKEENDVHGHRLKGVPDNRGMTQNVVEFSACDGQAKSNIF